MHKKNPIRKQNSSNSFPSLYLEQYPKKYDKLPAKVSYFNKRLSDELKNNDIKNDSFVCKYFTTCARMDCCLACERYASLKHAGLNL